MELGLGRGEDHAEDTMDGELELELGHGEGHEDHVEEDMLHAGNVADGAGGGVAAVGSEAPVKAGPVHLGLPCMSYYSFSSEVPVAGEAERKFYGLACHHILMVLVRYHIALVVLGVLVPT
jgi:hypothetical protein